MKLFLVEKKEQCTGQYVVPKGFQCHCVFTDNLLELSDIDLIQFSYHQIVREMHNFSLLLEPWDQVLKAYNFSSREFLHVLQVFSLDLAATLLFFSHILDGIKHLSCCAFHKRGVILRESSRQTFDFKA